jgi:hypothetical protein
LESIPGLLKHLQIRAQATLASGIGSLKSIPGLLKRLQIRATLASRIGFLESIPRLHNMMNNDEDEFFLLKRIYSSLNYQRDFITNLFVPKLSKERRKTKVFVPQLSKERTRSEVFVP